MSSLAPPCTLAVDREKFTCETGCNSGLVATCEHTSVNDVAVRSLILLCQIEGNPPLGHDKACSTAKDVPQAQCVGSAKRKPAIMQSKGILKGRFMQCKAIFIKGKSC